MKTIKSEFSLCCKTLFCFTIAMFHFNIISLANPIQINSKAGCAIEAGSIKITDNGEMLTVCINDKTLTPVDFNLIKSGNGENNKWVIADEDDIIQLALSELSSIDLYGAEQGTMQIWQLTWDGNLSAGLIAGTNAIEIVENSTCAALSNPVTIIKDCCCPYTSRFTLNDFVCVSENLFPNALVQVDTNLLVNGYRSICDKYVSGCSSEPKIIDSSGNLIAGAITKPGTYKADGCDCSEDVFLEITQDFLDDCTLGEVEEDTSSVCNGGLSADVPVVYSVYENSATIRWNPQREVSLQYKATDMNSWISPALRNGYVIIPNLEACKQYEVRLHYDCDSFAITSSIERFTTGGCISCVDLNTKIALINMTENAVLLSWDIVSGSLYTLHYKTSAESEWQTYNTLIPVAILFGLDECTEYEFAVTITCPNAGTSGFSNVVNFGENCSDLKPGTLPIYGYNSFNIYPNPAIDFIKISSVNDSEISTIKIFDVRGKLMFGINHLSFNGNTYTASLTDLPKGLYMVIVTAEDKMYSRTHKFFKE